MTDFSKINVNYSGKSVEKLIIEFEDTELNSTINNDVDLFIKKYGIKGMKRSINKMVFCRPELCDQLHINYKSPTIIDYYLSLEYQLFCAQLQ